MRKKVSLAVDSKSKKIERIYYLNVLAFSMGYFQDIDNLKGNGRERYK